MNTTSSTEEIYIGEYRLQRMKDGTFWLNKPEGQYAGEGMQTSEADLVAMLDEFWKDNF